MKFANISVSKKLDLHAKNLNKGCYLMKEYI